MSNNQHIGSSLDDFLAEEGLYEQANATAISPTVAAPPKIAVRRRHTGAVGP
jgi:hypothetical protein